MKESNALNQAAEGMEEFNSVKYLTDEEAINAYLSDIEKANDPMLLKLAMQNVEQARLINLIKK